MNFVESEQYLFSLGNEVSAMKLGLENIRQLLTALGNPQNNYLKVQVVGTNGKGSVCAFLDSICNTAGIRTGTFTSPHLVSLAERVRINGKDISEDKFAKYATVVRETSEKLVADGELEAVPTFFEQVTATALLAFAQSKIELAILETGLGGRLDATTAANAEIAAITRIDLDHQQYLGNTIEEIAAEKAAIIHEGSQVVIGEQNPQAMGVLVERCRQVEVSPEEDREASVLAVDTVNNSVVASFRAKHDLYDEANLGLKGRHQLENAKIAVMTAEVLRFGFGLDIGRDDVVDGLERARHPGRLEYQGKYLLDGAHNLGGVNALAEYLREFETRPITLVFGAMRDKDVTEMLAILAPLAEKIVVTQPTNSRAFSCEELLDQLPRDRSKEKIFAAESFKNANEIARTVTPQDGIILVTGSLYLVGEAKRILNSQI